MACALNLGRGKRTPLEVMADQGVSATGLYGLWTDPNPRRYTGDEKMTGVDSLTVLTSTGPQRVEVLTRDVTAWSE